MFIIPVYVCGTCSKELLIRESDESEVWVYCSECDEWTAHPIRKEPS